MRYCDSVISLKLDYPFQTLDWIQVFNNDITRWQLQAALVLNCCSRYYLTLLTYPQGEL